MEGKNVKAKNHDEKYHKAVETFYKLKKKYDDQLIKKKKSIKKLGTTDKKIEIEKFKKQRKCVNCKNIGGTIFEEKMRTLKAICGHKSPCNLHIEIEKPIHQYIPEQEAQIDTYIDNIKTDISIIKLDLLFDLMDDEVSINEFQTLKDELETELEFKKLLTDGYNELNNVIEITVDGGETKDILIKDYLLDLQKKYNQAVSEYKKRISEYETNNSSALLEDTIQFYLNTIIPLQNKIREMKYQITYITPDPHKWKQERRTPMPEFHYFPTKIDIKNQMIDTTRYKIISNKK